MSHKLFRHSILSNARVGGRHQAEFSTPCPRTTARVPRTLAERWARGGELRPIAQLNARVAWGRPITSQAIAQRNPTNSRATAVATTHFALPA